MKRAAIYILLLLMLCGIIGWQQSRMAAFRENNRILTLNVDALLNGQQNYMVRDSLHVARIGTLTLTVEDYKRLHEADARMIADLRIRLKRVEHVAKVASKNQQVISTLVRDTVMEYRDRQDTIRHFEYGSPYIDLRGVLYKDSVDIQLQSYDTLLQVIHRVPKRFWFIRYGTRAIRQEIVSLNPHTRITYSESIKLRR